MRQKKKTKIMQLDCGKNRHKYKVAFKGILA